MVVEAEVGYGVFLVFSAPGVFHQKEYDIHVNVFKFLLQRSTPNSFHMFANTPWNLWSSSFVSNSILHSKLLYVILFMYATYYFFVMSRIRFVLLQFFVVSCCRVSSIHSAPHPLSSYISFLTLPHMWCLPSWGCCMPQHTEI